MPALPGPVKGTVQTERSVQTDWRKRSTAGYRRDEDCRRKIHNILSVRLLYIALFGDAGNRVRYEDQSHFSREYKRHLGEPPIRDVERLH
jgi:hypothetical protein